MATVGATLAVVTVLKRRSAAAPSGEITSSSDGR